jgi:hypothetical protein
VPATSAAHNRLLFFFFFLLQPFTALMKQTRQAVHAIKQSIFLRCLWFEPNPGTRKLAGKLMRVKYKNRFMVLIPGNAVTPLSFTSTGGIFLLV